MDLSPRVSVCGPGDSMVSKGVVFILQGRISRARWAAGQMKSSVQQGRDSSCRCQGDQCGVEQHCVCGTQLCQQWSGACLSYTLKVVYSTLLSLFISVLEPLVASGEFPQEPIYGWSRSADTAVLITYTDILGVSSCQMCLL